MERKWSQLQQDIFDLIEDADGGNAVIEAVAGSGKTTTIVEGVKRAKGTTIFLAFNKSIAEELKGRGVNARTFHSLTYAPVTQARGTSTVDGDKVRKLCQRMLRGNDFEMYGTFVPKLVSLGKQMGIGCLLPDVTQSWLDICIHHDMEPEHEDADLGRALELASDILEASNSSSQVDFDDLLYLAVKDGISLAKYDFIFVDEAQDTNAIQRALLRKIMKKTSRLVAVGDPCQAIYGFRGADSNSLKMIAREFDCTSLPLSISYRCATNVVKHARTWVDHIEAAPEAEEGVVKNLGMDWDARLFNPNDLIVCRKTAPLINLAYSCLRQRVPVTVMGREIGQGLKQLIAKMKAGTVDELEQKLDVYMEREVEKARAKMDDGKVESITDRVSAVMCLANTLPEDSRTIHELITAIDSLFSDKANAAVLATIHKSKGLEADVVYWLDHSSCPSKWAKQDWQKEQERNLCYVATTRAKRELYLIDVNTK